MLSAYVTNLGRYTEGRLVGEWAEFPMSQQDFTRVLQRIGVDGEAYEEWFITDYDADIAPQLLERLGEYPALDQLNRWAESLEELQRLASDEKIAAVMEAAEPDEFDELLENPTLIGEWAYYPGVKSYEDLGKEVAELTGILDGVDEALEKYFDFKKYGRDYDLVTSGRFTRGGYADPMY